MTALERRAVSSLALLYSFRMLGLFMVLPLLSLYAADLPDATPSLIGLAVLCAAVMVSTPLMIVYARYARLEDSPGPRSSHQGCIPRGGGAIAMAALFLALLGLWPLAWPPMDFQRDGR